MTPITPPGIMTIPMTDPFLTYPLECLLVNIVARTVLDVVLVGNLTPNCVPLPKEMAQPIAPLIKHLLPYIGYPVLYMEFVPFSALYNLLYIRGVKGVRMTTNRPRTLPPSYPTLNNLPI